ncbi:MAG: energy-coupling factor transporter transmembrane component T [Eubacteriales bacterium]|nr:energy-coupling factor transporter transmembrane protein EcfT [Bacillota bacterium]MBV1728078.1 energy-coupling factor transporter transmembrane protein EcfT [Desulforudis sp.]MDP3050240.1 energy-coupling factor transporter transmembrane component T [Eubacteriales bacterium]MDQ7788648.1 energy-coupling factor transporter transmembrane component T [Clostridia bacterium]MBU4532516.1 energy-coupling factor transporter transmembrane protein EcfT [Bacillota bacterium]
MSTLHIQQEVDTYAGLDSWMHRWEPRLKIGAGLVFVVGVVLLQSPLLAAVALGIAVAAAVSSRLPLSFLITRWLWVLPFLAIMALSLSMGGGLGASGEGLTLAFLVSMKALTALTIMITLVGTQPLSALMNAFTQMRLPHLPVMALLLACRYLFCFRDELQVRQRAFAARAFQPKPNRRTVSVYGETTASMLLGALDRSEQVHRAMVARGFDGRLRTSPPRAINYTDLAKGVFSVASVTLLLLVDRGFPI